MKRTITTILALILVASFAASVYYSPYWTLYKMKVAVEDKDADGLSRHVDYPALRASLKSQVKTSLNRQMAQVGEQMRAFGATAEQADSVGNLLPTGLMDQMVDAMVSPQAVAAMVSGTGSSTGTDTGTSDGTAGQPGSAKDTGKPLDLTLRYRGWDEALFRARGEEGGFLFQRAGLWSWRLAGIDLGLAQLAQPKP